MPAKIFAQQIFQVRPKFFFTLNNSYYIIIFLNLGITARVLDVSDGPGIRALAEEIGTINVLFNCAG